MERLTILMEKILAHKWAEIILALIALIAPIYFVKTVWTVWFGPYEIFFGFKAERWTWFVMVLVDVVALLTLLPAREEGRIMQIVMLFWTIDMLLVFLATFVR